MLARLNMTERAFKNILNLNRLFLSPTHLQSGYKDRNSHLCRDFRGVYAISA